MKSRTKLNALLVAGTLLLSLACAVSAGGVTDGLAVHLTFDGNYLDSAGQHVDGTPVGNPQLVPGILGQAVSLTTLKDGSEFDYVTFGQPDLLMFGSDVDFTICFWTSYTNQVDDPAFISNKDWGASNNQGWIISTQDGGNFRVNVTDDRGASGKQNTTSTPNIRDGTWHHVAVTFARKGDVSIYVDGVLVTTSPMTAVINSIDTTMDINVGEDGTGYYTDGGSAEMVGLEMDDLGIWRRVLSAGEVAAIYNAGTNGMNLAQVPAIVDPYLKSTIPTANAAVVAPNATISAVIVDGLNIVASASVKMSVNGSEVPVSIAKTNAESTVRYTPTTLLPSGLNTAELVFGNNATPQKMFTNTWSFTCPYVTLPASLRVSPETAKPGFVWNVFANQANTDSSTARTEAALVGLLTDVNGDLLLNLADPAAQGVAIAAAAAPDPANAPITFEIASTINLSVTGGDANGNFTPDDQMPGLPATDGSNDGVAAEILTYIELPKGLTIMGVNSDDGFRTTAGPWDIFSTLVLGEYNGARGAADTIFMFAAEEAGVYPFRTTYEQGTDPGNVEWFTFTPDGVTKVLVNDVANGGLRAYRAATSPVQPYVKYLDPLAVPRQLNLVSSSLLVILADGDTAVNDNSIALKVNGTPVTVTKKRQGKTVSVAYAPTTLQIPDQQQSAELTYEDASGAYTRTLQWAFYNLKNLVLPAPAITENFDSYEEGTVPTGWTAWNFTECSGNYCATPGLDLDDLNSDTYRSWVVVSRDRLQGLKSRIFDVAPGQTFNGQPVTLDDLSTGNLLYAESDVRDGSQVQFIISKPFDLSRVTNVVMTFASLYEQNQDNIGAVEYSVDGGNNWLPVVYYLDTMDSSGSDIRLNPDGSVDAVRTLTDPNADTAYWVDQGVQKGGIYGDAIAAPITAALGPYIAPRWNDNPTVDKRIEVFRLPQAGKKADVRLRFAQIGTASWYFGVDNLAFYDVAPEVVVVPKLNLPTVSSGNVTITWQANPTIKLQKTASLTNPDWQDVEGTLGAGSATQPLSGTAGFYRLVKQ
jgi:hypothetical protein